MMTDPIADMFTRMRNALRIRRKKVKIPYSSVKAAIAEALKREGYIDGSRKLEAGPQDGGQLQGWIEIDLKYGPEGEDVITTIRRESTPGRRIYKGADELGMILNGLGTQTLSTSVGILSDREAREKRVGGEVLCVIT